jgi:hypothetical protein
VVASRSSTTSTSSVTMRSSTSCAMRSPLATAVGVWVQEAAVQAGCWWPPSEHALPTTQPPTSQTTPPAATNQPTAPATNRPTRLARKVGVGVVEQQHQHLAAVVLVDHARADVNKVLGGQAGARRHASIRAVRHGDGQPRVDGALAARGDDAVLSTAVCRRQQWWCWHGVSWWLGGAGHGASRCCRAEQHERALSTNNNHLKHTWRGRSRLRQWSRAWVAWRPR